SRVARSIRLSNSGSRRTARIRSFCLAIFLFLPGKSGLPGTVTGGSTDVQQATLHVEHPIGRKAIGYRIKLPNLFTTPLCTTTRLFSMYGLGCLARAREKVVNI